MEVLLQPNNKELTAVIGCLWAELDELKERVSGAKVITTSRVFTNADLIRGKALGLRAVVQPNGRVSISLES